MDFSEQKRAAKEFANRWNNKGYERGESQKFWIDLLENVFNISNVSTFIEFEDTVHIDKVTGFIDAFIPSTKVLIEQKSINRDLHKAIVQSDGSLLNPFQQAKRYSAELPYDSRPRWIITCNFKSFLVYDMNNPNGEPEEVLLKNLPKEFYRLQFLVDSKNNHIKKEEELSFKAGELVGKLYDAFSIQYNDLNKEQSQKDLNELCVRVVFCLYAEDAGLFGKKSAFHDFLAKYEDLALMRKSLIELFKILDTPLEERDPYLEDDINQFPYVNGGLFSNENIEIPTFTEEIKNILLAKASDEFDWSEISPTIFGAVFESTLNPETRRNGGMHYTSIENIHKVIDPLFLDDLRLKLNKAQAYKKQKTRNEALLEFQQELSELVFLDPACGSGNFLTESYLSLRYLENEALATMQHGEITLGFNEYEHNPIKVNINQFYGIEINDFAIKVAKAALWIAESQMVKKTEEIVHMNINFLPLKTYANIYDGNALKIDWNDIVPKDKVNYIMGNPPFRGYSLQTETQKQDILDIYKDSDGNLLSNAGKIDYVAGWYYKAAHYMCKTKISCAFVSTNSITEGEQVASIWEPLYKLFSLNINFAYRTFKWSSESNLSAQVFCVIIGFSCYNNDEEKFIVQNDVKKIVNNINPFLIEAPTVFVHSISKPLCDIPIMISGGKPVDGGNLILSIEEKTELIKKYPDIDKYIRPFVSAKDYIENNIRYCLWLVDCSPSELRKYPEILSKINAVKEFRMKSKKAATREMANNPKSFMEIKESEKDFLIIPNTSSDKRKYIPIGYLNKKYIISNASSFVPNASLFIFGVLTSNVHMAWIRAVAGRLGTDYRYSINIVYNNFPWPTPTEEQKLLIEKTAQAILDARVLYKDSSLADLYDDLTMPVELRRAHQLNDKAVWEAYGKKWDIKSESDCVTKLMEMYQELSNN